MSTHRNMAIIIGFLLLATASFGLDMRQHGHIQHEIAATEKRLAQQNQRAVLELARYNRAQTKKQIQGIKKQIQELPQLP